jgi:opacity protein-like surface antigen
MTTIKHRVRHAIWVIAVLIVADVSVAFAQTQVRVRRDKTTIWRRDARIVAVIVSRGTLLEVTGREGEWYVVVIPPGSVEAGALGLIAASQVEIVAGGSVPETTRPQQPSRGRPAAAAQIRGTPGAPRHTELFGFGHAGYGAWLAHDTFTAVTDSAGAPMFGGGAQVRFGSGAFIEGTVERLEKTGQRVFVSNGQVFSLGIADTVRVIPIFASVGYRHVGRKATPYVGGGVGTYLYKETSDFADPSENLDEHFTSYQVLAGVEFPSRSWVRPAVEVQFTTVPKALGDSGASAAFNEHNLGGIQVRVKILVGR